MVFFMEVESAVNKVLGLSPSVRVVTICDMNGKVTFSARRKSVKNALSPNESKASLRTSAKNMKGRKALARKLGKCRYTLAEYDKVKRIVLPAGNTHLFFVTCSPGYDHMKIVRKVKSFK